MSQQEIVKGEVPMTPGLHEQKEQKEEEEQKQEEQKQEQEEEEQDNQLHEDDQEDHHDQLHKEVIHKEVQNDEVRDDHPAKRIKIEEPIDDSTLTSSTTPQPNTDETSTGPHETSTGPVHEIVGGSSVRQYLNKHLTKHLLEGLQEVSTTKPHDPLRALGEFLISRSDQLNDN